MRLQHRTFSSFEATLEKARRLVGEETGVIRLLHEPPIAPDAPRIFGCGSLCSDYSHLGYPSENFISGSTSLVRGQAIAGAVGEAVERYSAAFVPYEEITVLPYSEVADEGVDPWSLTLYDDDQYQQSDFGYGRLTAEEPIGWVTGHSLTHNTLKLVPAFSVYQPYRSLVGETAVVQQITTGLACGNTIEEAILSATCEVVERDAAMLMWLQSRRAAKVVLPNGSGSLVSAVLESLGHLKKYITVLDVTTDIGIPAFVAVWDGPLDRERGVVFSSCAKLSAEHAVAGAITELAQCLMWVGSLLDSKKPLPDPSREKIFEIEEHVLWPMRSTARPWFEFALSSTSSTDLSAYPNRSSSDVLESINTCVDLLAAQDFEVIAVDVTSPDIRETGLHVVRVIIPGAQPLFFGTGFHRVSKRARSNDYGDRASRDINLHPHPFP